MGENNNSYFEKVLLKNIDEDITNIRTSKSELKSEILLELRHRFPAKKKEINTLKSLSKASTIKSLHLKPK